MVEECGKSWRASELRLQEVEYFPRQRIARHSHEMACFGLTLRGSNVESFDGDRFECTSGTVLTRPCGEEHSDQVGISGARVFIMEMPASWVAYVHEHGKIITDPMLHPPGELAGLMKSIYREALQNDAASSLAVQSLAFEMAAHLVRNTVSKKQRHVPLWLKLTRDRLDSCYSENLTLAELARDAGVHKVHLSRAFRLHYSTSVGEYLRRRRIQAAAGELTSGDGSLADIALRAGFSSQSHFCSVFKLVTGRTPSQFRFSRLKF